MMYELADWNSATFLTLNYSDDYFNWLLDQGRYDEINNLSPKEVSAYFKRVRRGMSYYFDDFQGFKMYTSAEYGPTTHRAHYHSIIFGLDWNDDDTRDILKFAWNEKRQPVPRNEDFQWLRSRGRKSAIQPVTPDDIRYVAGYVQKKLFGDEAKKVYGNRTPPFSQMSKGIGLNRARQNYESLKKGWTYLPGGKKIAVPRYFREKLGIPMHPKPVDDKAEFEYMWNAFQEKYPALDVTDSRTLPLFEHFVEQKEWQYAEQVFKDFAQRSKMLGGQ